MKHLLIALATLATFSVQAQNWSDIDFGELPMTKDFRVEGKLEKKGLFSFSSVDLTLWMAANELGGSAVDRYYKHHHRVEFSIDDLECEGVSRLTTEDEMGAEIKYSMIINYDDGQKDEGCPYQVQVDFGAMEEDRGGKVFTRLIVYPTNRLYEKEVYEGKLIKD